MSAVDRCPYLPASPHAPGWIERYEKALANVGLHEDEVMSIPEIFELGGHTYLKGRGGLLQLEHINGPRPEPVFQVVRSRFYRRTDVERWLAPRLAIRGALAERQAARQARSQRRQDRMEPGRSVGGYKGVRRNHGTWAAVDNVTVVGNYATIEEAAMAVDKHRMLHGFPPCNLPDRVDEHDLVPILRRKRALESGRRLLEVLAKGPMTLDELWRENQHASPPERWKTQDSLRAGLSKSMRQGKVVRVGGRGHSTYRLSG